MTAKKGKKLCWNCEGELERDAILCRFCGVNVLHVSGQEMPSSTVPLPPYAVASEPSEEQDEEIEDEEDTESEAVSGNKPFSLTGFFSFILGSFFFLFAFSLLFFSREGVLTLRWDASYWLLYALLSLPLLFIGWRLSKSA